MNAAFRPLFVVPAVPQGDGIRFLHPDQQYDIAGLNDELWFLMSESNGYQSVDTIAKKASKRFAEMTQDVVSRIFTELSELGLVADSSRAYGHLHSLTMNPMNFTPTSGLGEDHNEGASQKVGQVVPYDEAPVSHLQQLLRERKSCRSFAADAVSVDDLGSLLSASSSIQNGATPSAGGLYPLKLYVIVTRQTDQLTAGYYEFTPQTGELILYNEQVDLSHLEYAFNSDTLLYGAPVIVVLAADLNRHARKYSNRGYRFTLLEAGHVAQNIHLVATDLKLATLECGSFLDEVLGDELDMDMSHIMPLIAIAVGKESLSSAFDSASLLNQLEEQLVGVGKPIRYVRESTDGRIEQRESFYGATALYKPNGNQDASETYSQRFSAGTATSASLAKVKALAEAYERYVSGEIRIDRTDRADALPGAWLDPRQVTPFTPEQHASFNWLKQFDPTDVREWVLGVDMHGDDIWVPAELVYYPLTEATFSRPLCYEANSSGVAAYSNRQEAIVRGALELIERDAIMRNWFSRRAAAKIPHHMLPYHWKRRAEFWRSKGRSVDVLDHSAYGVVTVNVVIASPELFPCFVTGSASSVISFDEAVAKAFHEAELGLAHALRQPKHRPIETSSVVSPIDHAKLYAYPEHFGNVEWMLQGKELLAPPAPTVKKDDLLRRLNAVVVTLSPEGAPLHVVRVLSDKLIPMNFGEGTEHYAHNSLTESDVHPDSLLLPHYFA